MNHIQFSYFEKDGKRYLMNRTMKDVSRVIISGQTFVNFGGGCIYFSTEGFQEIEGLKSNSYCFFEDCDPLELGKLIYEVTGGEFVDGTPINKQGLGKKRKLKQGFMNKFSEMECAVKLIDVQNDNQ
jgi:hypothetical protein